MARKISTNRTGNSGVVKDGIYELQILEATEKPSKSGNDMIELQLGILRNGSPSGPTIWDYLVFNDDDPDKTQWKFDQLHDALEVEEGKEISFKYYKNKRVYASLSTDEYNGNVKNKVKSYLNPDVARDLLSKQNGNSETDDEDDDDLDMAPSLETPLIGQAARQQANMAGKGKRAGKTSVAELEDEDMPL